MALPYPYVTTNPQHLNTGSYLNQQETANFVSGFSMDLWYGFSEADVIELSVFDLDQNALGWTVINPSQSFNAVTSSYLNTLDQTIPYSYREFISNFILYKNKQLLVNPCDQLSSSFGIISGSYITTYNFTREMAGTPMAPLVVKDISPSRKEVKLTPLFDNTPRYQAFCTKQFQVKTVAPLLIQLTNQCPYDQIYSRIKDNHANQITFLKNLLFLQTDGAFISFLKTLYEDVVIYTNSSDTNQPVEKEKRTQGIRTYYQNTLLSNYETISTFTEIDAAYNSFVNLRIQQLFAQYGTQSENDFARAQQFLVDFFTTNFYIPLSNTVRASFNEKYYSYFKNAINMGNNTMFVILDHSYSDERVNATDPLTLLVKLKDELSDDVKIQSQCWISNISLTPFVINTVLQTPSAISTIKISPPNFALETNVVSLYNVNKSYTATDLSQFPADQQTININKNINAFQVDYSDFSNFVVFSSANQRTANFKTKIATWYSLSASLVTLDNTESQFIASGSVFPYYSTERGVIQSQMTDIVSSFDGYESYLFKSGSYAFDVTANQFVNVSYVADKDAEAVAYDKENQDSLINNTPQHIVLDADNDEYLMFLNMTGHFFDNIYLYITNLPSEKIVTNDPTKTFTKKMVDYMLDSFGWKIGNTYEDSSILDAFTTSVSSSMSAEDRTKAIRTRILSTLPQVYKTAGTEEAVKLLLACHGIPSDLLNIREYGSYNYYTGSAITYTKRERACMFGFSGSFTFITQLYELKPQIRTVEFKLAIHSPEIYESMQPYAVAQATNTYTIKWDKNWNIHKYYGDDGDISPYVDMGYYNYGDFPTWEIGFWKETGNMGRVYVKFSSRHDEYVPEIVAIPADSGSDNSFFVGLVGTGSYIDVRTGSYANGFSPTIIGGYSGSFYIPSGSFTVDGISGSFFTTASHLAPYTGSEINYEFNAVSLTSSLFPILDGDIFNVRLRRNDPDPFFQYFSNQEFIPTKYDLTVQRNESGRQVFRSIDSRVGEYMDNLLWDGVSPHSEWETTGSMGTTTTSSVQWGEFYYNERNLFVTSPVYNMEIGNVMVWDVPITDDDFEIHCNDFSSFAYSGSNAKQHLITRMDYDEAVDFLGGSGYYYTYYDGPDLIYWYGYGIGTIPNRSEYYSTFEDRYGTINVSGVVASGSWTGAKAGSLLGIENFSGSMWGIISGSLSGSGQGFFTSVDSASMTAPFYASKFVGYMSGSMSGSFNAFVSGDIQGSEFQTHGILIGKWTGSVSSPDIFAQSVFSGSYFTGSASGSIFGLLSGSMYSATVGLFNGTRFGPWYGTFTGSVSNGSIKAMLSTGSFDGYASGSDLLVQDVGTLTGTISNQIWWGTLTGSFTGSFSGSTGQVYWSGSSPFNYAYTPPIGVSYLGLIQFSGSMTGVASSSFYFNSWATYYPYGTGMFTGSFMQPWTGSPVVLYNEPIMPRKITYGSYNYVPLNPTLSYEYRYCNDITVSVYKSEYPYELVVKDIEKTYTTPFYGPNRFKNEKITKKEQNVAARLDDKDRSTFDQVLGTPTDSNILGLYLDPQDAKNRDIVKYLGNQNLMELIADPANMYSASYLDLDSLNQDYNSFGDRRVLYNELITLYKIYFDRSVFDTVKNIVPARTSTRTGILVEPTILERPKYQHRPVFSEENTGSVFYDEVTASHYAGDYITKLVRFSGSQGNISDGQLTLLYGEFNTAGVSSMSLDYSTLPSNPSIDINISYINEATFDYPVNCDGGYIMDLADDLQLGNYGSTTGLLGVTIQEDLNDQPHPSGSQPMIITKQWDKYTIYSKTGPYVRTSDKNEDRQSSHSVWMYKLVGLTPDGFNRLFYTSSKNEPSKSLRESRWNLTPDINYVLGKPHYFHNINTAKGTPNERINVIKATDFHLGSSIVYAAPPYYNVAENTYYEIFSGYPRNHYTHKRMEFSPIRQPVLMGKSNFTEYQLRTRSRQTIDTTVDYQSGLNDTSLPIQTIQTSNVNLVRGDNVINP